MISRIGYSTRVARSRELDDFEAGFELKNIVIDFFLFVCSRSLVFVCGVGFALLCTDDFLHKNLQFTRVLLFS